MEQKSVEQAEQVLTGKLEDLDSYIHQSYDNQINYYWRSSSQNKKNYKRYRTWTIILGALVTLVASLTTAEFITRNETVHTVFTIGTPLLAATLTIINSLSQSFQWGSTWRDTVINAQRLVKERDRFLATDSPQRNYLQEIQIINEMVLDETQTFFQRVLDSEVIPSRNAPVNPGAAP